MRWAIGLVVAIGVPGCGFAQFFGMATPGDGSRVYFATPSRVKASGQNFYGKIFQYDANGLRLVPASDPVPLPNVTPPFGGATTNAFDLGMADTSSDGHVAAFGAERHCAGSDVVLCSKQELFSTTITANGQSRDYPGMLRLSANGQWAFGAGSQSNAVFFRTLGYRVNLATGDTRSIQGEDVAHLDGIQVSNTSRTVSDTGTAVFFYQRNVYVLKGDEISAIPTLGIVFDAVIDAAADKIVFSSGGPCSELACPTAPTEVRITSPGASGSLLLASGYAPSMTDDGRQVLYLSDRGGSTQIYMIGTDGAGDRRLTSEADGITRAIVSGDGTVSYALTGLGRLIRIATAAATVRELIPSTPYLGTSFNVGLTYLTALPVLAPNKLLTLPGTGLSPSTMMAGPPLPSSLGGVQASIQGITAKIAGVGPDSVTVIVPPGVTPDAAAVVQVNLATQTPFEAARAATVSTSAPEFLLGPPLRFYSGLMLAAHQDWSGLISEQSPARPGEVVHAYAVGLGPTNPMVGYGEAAPSQEPFARLATSLACTAYFQTPLPLGVPVEILFAGLAPGFAGVYQIDWRVPAAATGFFSVSCTLGDRGVYFGGGMWVGNG
jgi:uncharacterized protein (TIGR03437 family)